MRHQAGVVDDYVDAPVRLDRAIDQPLDLLAVGDVGLDRRVRAKLQLFGQRLKPVEPARAENELRAFAREMPRGGLAQPAARAGDDDDLAVDVR